MAPTFDTWNALEPGGKGAGRQKARYKERERWIFTINKQWRPDGGLTG